LDWTIYRQSRASSRYVIHCAIATPRPIDAHHVDINAPLEFYALALTVPVGHGWNPINYMANP
jgi:hypothetical protein